MATSRVGTQTQKHEEKVALQAFRRLAERWNSRLKSKGYYSPHPSALSMRGTKTPKAQRFNRDKLERISYLVRADECLRRPNDAFAGQAPLAQRQRRRSCRDTLLCRSLSNKRLMRYQHKDIGWASLGIIAAIFVVNSVFWRNVPLWINLLIVIGLFFCAFFLSSLTIRITDEDIEWWFTAGLARKKLFISDIRHASARTIIPLGWGIRTNGR